MGNNTTPPGDEYMIRCPKLGHQISFSYCRSENMGRPCFKVLDCWFQYFPVEEYLRNELTTEEWGIILDTPVKSKIQSLMELIEQAKKIKD